MYLLKKGVEKGKRERQAGGRDRKDGETGRQENSSESSQEMERDREAGAFKLILSRKGERQRWNPLRQLRGR